MPAHPCVFVCASVCAPLCGNINRLYSCISAFFPLPLLLCSNSLCAGAQSSVSINLLYFGLFFCISLVNIPIYTCASSFPRVNSQVRPSVSAFATRQRREKNRTGRSGRGGRWQVDYGRRSRCLETAGTRDARLLGNQHDAMTSAVWWSWGEAKTENCLCAPNTPIPRPTPLLHL